MENSVGAWSEWKEIDSKAKEVFAKASEGFAGVKYTPYLYASQMVAGTNYCFDCIGTVIYKDPVKIVSLVYIYQPLNGDPYISEIKRINPS